jgi:hypothetical protein
MIKFLKPTLLKFVIFSIFLAILIFPNYLSSCHSELILDNEGQLMSMYPKVTCNYHNIFAVMQPSWYDPDDFGYQHPEIDVNRSNNVFRILVLFFIILEYFFSCIIYYLFSRIKNKYSTKKP